MKGTVFILEDDERLRELLVEDLREEGYRASGMSTASALLQSAASGLPDAFVIDIGLPDADGRDVCATLRARGVITPVLFLTAYGELADRLSGFDVGGDDYLVKPFPFAELVARLETILGRAGVQSTCAGPVEIDDATHALVSDTGTVALTPTEFRIVSALAESFGVVVGRTDLMSAAWPDGILVNLNTLDAYIARLRRKLAAAGGGAAIRTVHGMGYVLE